MRTALRMIKGNQMLWRSTDGTRIMVMLLNSPISERKRQTALYQNGNDDFITTSLDNAFRIDPTKIKSFPLRELQPVCGVGEIGIYKHKSRAGFYVSKVVPRTEYYDPFGIRLKMFRRDYAILTVSYLNGDVTFEDYDLELIFRELLDV